MFTEMGEMLEFLGENPFRVRAYLQAARVLADLEQPIEQIAGGGVEKLDSIPGIGKDLALKIVEYLHSGKVRAHQELVRRVPQGVLEVMRVPGIGPKTAKQLSSELKVISLPKLKRALESGKVLTLAGFGEAKRQRLLENLELAETATKRRPLGEVLWRLCELLGEIRKLPAVEQAEYCGSARRYKETVGDLDFLVASKNGEKVVQAFVKLPEIADVETKGPNRATVFLKDGLQVDLKIVPPASWGSGLQYLTGSKEHGIRLRNIALKQGLKLNEYGVWRGSKRIAGADEEGVYQALGLPLIPPPLRENTGEIEAAALGKLPKLVLLGEIKGDLHAHSAWSDGKNSLWELAGAARELGYSYLAVTDHSPAVRVAGGVPAEKMKERIRAIQQVNEKTGGKPYLLAGAEVDILEDGSLDYPDAVLGQLEIVLVAIHSRFGMPGSAMTRRILKGLENPNVHILSHPTCRIFGQRKQISADWEQIFERARALGKAVEIDGYYDRMDLPDTLARRAGEVGVMVSLGTDAHQIDHLKFMDLAVGTAQRAWLSSPQILNTKGPEGLRYWLESLRSG